MERRLFANYIARFTPGFSIIPVYAIIVALLGVAAKDEMTLLVLFSFMLTGLFLWYFTFDAYQNDVFRTVMMLPISRMACVRTLWWEAVPMPTAIGCLHFVLGHALLSILVPGKFALWHQFMPFLIVVLALANGVFATIFLLRAASHAIRALVVVLMVGLCILCRWIWVSWGDDPVTLALVLSGTLGMSLVSYRWAPILMDIQAGHRRSGAAGAGPVGPLPVSASQDISLRWYDPFLANPIGFGILGASALILVSWFLTGFILTVLGMPSKLLSPTVLIILIYAATVFVFVYSSGSFISSLRVFGCLPISKARLTATCLALPFVALLPVASLSILFSPVLLAVYVAGVGCWLMTNLAYMLQNKMVAAIMLNLVWVLGGLWQFSYTSMIVAKQPEAAGMLVAIGVVLLILMIIIPAAWTWRLLRNSNAPYQKKPGLRVSL